MLLLRLGYIGAGAAAAVLIADAVSRRWFNRETDWPGLWNAAISFGWIQLLLIAVAFVLIRRIVMWWPFGSAEDAFRKLISVNSVRSLGGISISPGSLTQRARSGWFSFVLAARSPRCLPSG